MNNDNHSHKDKEADILALNKFNSSIDNVFLSRTDDKALYLRKKTEKISGAIYMISNFFSVEEPLKWALREEAVGLVKDMAEFANCSLAGKESIIRSVASRIFSISSLIDVSRNAGFISLMNAEVITKELFDLILKIESKDSNELSVRTLSFDKSFFDVEQAPKPVEKAIDKGHFIKDKDMSFKPVQPSVPVPTVVKVNNNPVNNRTEAIIKALEKGGFMSIKDFTKVIKNCSEKTIQRELISLVNKGILQKTGERRWSTYSLSK